MPSSVLSIVKVRPFHVTMHITILSGGFETPIKPRQIFLHICFFHLAMGLECVLVVDLLNKIFTMELRDYFTSSELSSSILLTRWSKNTTRYCFRSILSGSDSPGDEQIKT